MAAKETPEETAAWDALIAEANRPQTIRLDRERTATSLPLETWRTCAFCPATAWWEVAYIEDDSIWATEEAELIDTCGEHLYNAFS